MNVIVTGGSGDIGGACARLLAARRDDVLIVDYSCVPVGPVPGLTSPVS